MHQSLKRQLQQLQLPKWLQLLQPLTQLPQLLQPQTLLLQTLPSQLKWLQPPSNFRLLRKADLRVGFFSSGNWSSQIDPVKTGQLIRNAHLRIHTLEPQRDGRRC